jgi:hypothetical protein
MTRRRSERQAWLWTAVLLLAAVYVLAQGEGAAELEVEVVFAGSQRQALVVARAMRTDFFVEQLLIPGTRYVGRVPLSDLQPELRDALADLPPGEPLVKALGTGNHLVARRLVKGPPALLGETAYAEEPDKVWAVLSVGPTDLRRLSLEVDVDTESLTGICRSKRELAADGIRDARTRLATLPPEAGVTEVIQAHSNLTSVLSAQGDMAGAIESLEALDRRLQAQPAATVGDQPALLKRFLGILELRRGEIENCLNDHNREMCLFPLSEAARHRRGDGGRRAFAHFSDYLESHPTDLEVRWLLNVAAMTVGSFPNEVPEQLRLESRSFASEIDPGRFWDVAGPAGVAYSDNAGGSIADDFDGDGLIDLVVSSRDPCEPLRLYRNSGDGTFADHTEAAGLTDQLGGLNVLQVDYDNDGRLDLFVMRGGWETAIRNSLLRNRPTADGGVRFEDVTMKAGLGGPAHRTHSAAWADYDGDGWLDVFIGHELSFSQLFRNRGDGTFEDKTVEAGMRFRSFTKGASWGDVDGDGRPDLYVSNFGERNLLFVNRGDGRFDEVAVERGVGKPTYSFATWFWDYDNDGWQDLFVATYLASVDEAVREYLGRPPKGETQRIYRNRGDGSFEDVSAALGVDRMIATMGANFGDLDNDGYLDFYLGTGAPSYSMLVPNRMFLNQAGKRFVDVTTATGTGHLQKGHGVAFADLDNDGDEDIFSNMGGAFLGDKYPSALFENPGHGNDWIAVELIGRRSNRKAVGARIRVVLDVGGSQEQRVRWVTSGGSFGSSPLMQHIGLGRDADVLRLEIDWPVLEGGRPLRQVVEDVPANSYVQITEGEEGFRLRPRPRLTLGIPGAAHDHGSSGS